jgi:hypothetical protein
VGGIDMGYFKHLSGVSSKTPAWKIKAGVLNNCGITEVGSGVISSVTLQ